ncbi:hypothetical protein BASA81_000457 [Batrachochytrium salamandrivorans]|nr:hypothetical protein BASA81_000457 [Batrachochytrium salamandrivorans]
MLPSGCECDQGHALRRFRIQDVYFCSKCEEIVQSGQFMFACFADDFDLCQNCLRELCLQDSKVLAQLLEFSPQYELLLGGEEAELNRALELVCQRPIHEQGRRLVVLMRCSIGKELDLSNVNFPQILTECDPPLLLEFITEFAFALEFNDAWARLKRLPPVQALSCFVDLANYHTLNQEALAWLLCKMASTCLEEQRLALNALGNLALHKEFRFPPGVAAYVSSLLFTSQDDLVLKLAIRVIYCYCGLAGELTLESANADSIVSTYPVLLMLLTKRKPHLQEYILNRMSYLTSQLEYYDVVFGNQAVVKELFALAMSAQSSEGVKASAWENLTKAVVGDYFELSEFNELIRERLVPEHSVLLEETLNFFDRIAKTRQNRVALAEHKPFMLALSGVLQLGGFHVLCSLSSDAPLPVFEYPGLVDLVLAGLNNSQLDDVQRERAGGVLENLAGCVQLKTPLFGHSNLVASLLERIPTSPPPVSLRCVRTLGFLSWENCEELFRFDRLMPVLMDTMATQTEFPDLIEQAANVIGNLALEDELRAPLFNYAGLLEQIIHKLLEVDPGNTKSSLIRVLQQVSIPLKFESFRYPRMGEMIVHLLTTEKEAELRQECLEFCCHLSCEPRNKAPMLHYPQLFQCLVDSIKRPLSEREVAKNALITIAHLAWENRVEIAEFPLLLDCLVNCLAYDRMDSVITDHAATICNNLALEEDNHATMFAFPNLVSSLIAACVHSPAQSKTTKRWTNASLVSLTTLLPANRLGITNNSAHLCPLLNAIYDGQLTELLALFLNLGWTEQRVQDFDLGAHAMMVLCTVKWFPRIGARSQFKLLPMHLVRDVSLYLY